MGFDAKKYALPRARKNGYFRNEINILPPPPRMRRARRTLFDAVGFVILALLAVAFIHTQVRNGHNISFHRDDILFFLDQFMRRFLDVDSVSEKIAYFFSPSHFPHAKLSGRLISYVHYLLFGTVDFAVLKIAGGCVLCAFVFAARFTLIGNFLLAVPLGIILLAPHWPNFWVTLITGYPFLLLYAALIYWLFSRKRDFMALPLCAVASFTHSPGLLVFVPVLVVLLLSRPIDFRRVALWGSVFALTIVLYYFFVLQHGRSIIRTDQTASIGQSLLSGIVYGAKFVMMPFAPFLGRSLPSGLSGGRRIVRATGVVFVTRFSVGFSLPGQAGLVRVLSVLSGAPGRRHGGDRRPGVFDRQSGFTLSYIFTDGVVWDVCARFSHGVEIQRQIVCGARILGNVHNDFV